MMRSDALFWSKMDTMPVLWHDDELDTDAVAWNGIMMTVEHGLMIASALLLNIHPTHEMKRVASQEWVRLVKGKVFGDVDWNIKQWSDHHAPLYSYYMNNISKVKDKLEKMPPESIFSMFNLDFPQK